MICKYRMNKVLHGQYTTQQEIKLEYVYKFGDVNIFSGRPNYRVKNRAFSVKKKPNFSFAI